MEQSLCKKP